MRLLHVLNPVKMPEDHELEWTQKMVFESMRQARERSNLQIGLLASSFEEDASFIPDYFVTLPFLERSVQDLGNFSDKRKLPLITDILKAAYDYSQDGDYLIYTNADILVLPQFYEYIQNFIENDLGDALIVNRRRIGQEYKRVEDLPMVWSEIGKSHPGFDCFVFKRELFPQMVLGNVCIGIPYIGVTLAHNIFALAERPVYKPDLHLTVHMGMEVLWKSNQELYNHNFAEFKKNNAALKPKYKLEKFPYSELSFFERIMKWGLNPSLPIKTEIELEGKGLSQRWRYYLNEIRWKLIQK